MAAGTGQRQLSMLESLPVELCNRIYRYAVVEEKPVIAATLIDSWGKKTWRSKQPELAATCKQLRREILPIFYAENTFVFEKFRDDPCLKRFRGWLRSTGDHISDIQRMGANFFIFKKFEGGPLKEVDCTVTATLAKPGYIRYHLSAGLEDQCVCGFEEWECIDNFEATRFNLLEHSVFRCCSRLFYRFGASRRTICMCCERIGGSWPAAN